MVTIIAISITVNNIQLVFMGLLTLALMILR